MIDAGPGLPPEQAAHVFERFWRADKARTRARGGSGLGLSIVAPIVQAHGGTVHFDSRCRRAAARSPCRLPGGADATQPVRLGTIVGMAPRDPSELDPAIAARLKRDAAGLVAAVVQQHDTGEVLMVGWMDDEALHRTLTTGRATYWSRSRQEYWVKGETSGHVAVRQVGRAGLRRRRAAGPGRPGRRGLPHRRPAPASTPASCRHRDRRSAAAELERARRARTGWCRSPAPCSPTPRRPVGVYRKLAGGRPGTFLLESAEPGRVVLALVVRRRERGRLPVRRDGEAAWTGDGAGRTADRAATRWRCSARPGGRSRRPGCPACRR